jgi:hypothetical protein
LTCTILQVLEGNLVKAHEGPYILYITLMVDEESLCASSLMDNKIYQSSCLCQVCVHLKKPDKK